MENYGITGSVIRDEDPTDPRENDNIGNIGTMHCQHGRYTLGDKDTNRPADINDGSYIMLPLYLYDHGSITMSTTEFSCNWDSGMVGIIYAKKGSEDLSDSDLKKVLEAEVKEYDNFLTGNCWGYVIEQADGEVGESCWGYLGDEEYCRKEMESMLATCIKQEGERIENRNEKYRLEDWMHEVASRDTVLGLEEWRQHTEESDAGS